jgi:hypothetical protein
VNVRLERLLEKAERIWQRHDRLPLDLATELMSLGVNVEALEAQYLNS